MRHMDIGVHFMEGFMGVLRSSIARVASACQALEQSQRDMAVLTNDFNQSSTPTHSTIPSPNLQESKNPNEATNTLSPIATPEFNPSNEEHVNPLLPHFQNPLETPYDPTCLMATPVEEASNKLSPMATSVDQPSKSNFSLATPIEEPSKSNSSMATPMEQPSKANLLSSSIENVDQGEGANSNIPSSSQCLSLQATPMSMYDPHVVKGGSKRKRIAWRGRAIQIVERDLGK